MAHVHDKYDFTVSMFLLHPIEKKLALHYHEKLGLWNNFGGHIELDEDPLECLEKEMIEETGLLPDDYDIIVTHDSPKNVGVKELPNPFAIHMWKYGELDHWHIDLPFVIKCKTDVIKPQENESQQTKWLTLKEIKSLHSTKHIDTGVLNICEWIFENHM